MAKLAVILVARWREPPYILIDDAHMFKPWEPERASLCFILSHWLTLEQVASVLEGFAVVESGNVLYALPRGLCWEPIRADPSKQSSGLYVMSPWWRVLVHSEQRVFSQNGEDGVIERILEHIGVTNKFCVEFGVQDGRECNTRVLRERKGWDGLWLDASDWNRDTIHRAWITAENVNDIFDRYRVPQEFDLLSIDIDGNDYWVWRALRYRPRVVVIEYNASLPPPLSRTIRYDPMFQWDGSNYFGANLVALARLGLRKGYTLVYCESVGVNAFFVLSSLMDPSQVEPVECLYRPPAYGQPGIGHPDSGPRDWVEVEDD